MRKIIVVTGASSGFGRLASNALALAGHTVYASMRETKYRSKPQVADAEEYAVINALQTVGAPSMYLEPILAILDKIWVMVGLLVVPPFAVLAAIVGMTAGASETHADTPAQKPACQGDNGGLTLSPGFCATIFADNLGMSAISWWRRIARSTPTPGAAATFPMRPRHRAVFF